jgi:DNA-binding winged helix-turn-helix (wHTH) protein
VTAYKLFEFPPFILDKTNAILWRADQSVAIRPKNLEVLCYLVERHGQLVSKDELLEKVWQSRRVEEAVLKVCINELRQALGDNAHLPRFIATISRRGYRFIAPVTEVRSASAIENICFDAYDRDKAPVRAAYW